VALAVDAGADACHLWSLSLPPVLQPLPLPSMLPLKLRFPRPQYSPAVPYLQHQLLAPVLRHAAGLPKVLLRGGR